MSEGEHVTVKDCHHPWTWAFITTDGNVMPCCFAKKELGNLGDFSLEEIWNGAVATELRSFVKRDILHPVCIGAACKFAKNSERSAVYPATLSQGMQFCRPGLPDFLRKAEGLSSLESWGRWSDAEIAPSVRLEFVFSLPKSFVLVITANAFGPNTDQECKVKIGSRSLGVVIGPDYQEVRLRFDLGEENVNVIEILPPHPISPADLGTGTDRRKLGIGLRKLCFEGA